MTFALWISQALLAAVFLGAGMTKLVRAREQLAASLPFVEDFSPAALKAIGGLEVLGAIGIVAPAATGILPALTPLAAAGLALDMVAAALVHLRRGELGNIVVNAALFGLATWIAVAHWSLVG